MKKLRKKHRETLNQIFERPAPSGVRWQEIESLVRALGGEITQGRGSRCWLALNEQAACFHRPHPSPETDKGALADVRAFLIRAGVTL